MPRPHPECSHRCRRLSALSTVLLAGSLLTPFSTYCPEYTTTWPHRHTSPYESLFSVCIFHRCLPARSHDPFSRRFLEGMGPSPIEHDDIHHTSRFSAVLDIVGRVTWTCHCLPTLCRRTAMLSSPPRAPYPPVSLGHGIWQHGRNFPHPT